MEGEERAEEGVDEIGNIGLGGRGFGFLKNCVRRYYFDLFIVYLLVS